MKNQHPQFCHKEELYISVLYVNFMEARTLEEL
jgi:hypothetical protein